MSLDNYDDLANSMEHVQKVCNSLELVIQDHDLMCKIVHTTFKGSTHAYYNKLELDSIEEFSDLYTKLVAYVGTSIAIKKNSTKLFQCCLTRK